MGWKGDLHAIRKALAIQAVEIDGIDQSPAHPRRRVSMSVQLGPVFLRFLLRSSIAQKIARDVLDAAQDAERTDLVLSVIEKEAPSGELRVYVAPFEGG